MYLFIWPPKVFQRLDKNDKNVLIESPTAVLDRCMTFADCRPQTADRRLQTADC